MTSKFIIEEKLDNLLVALNHDNDPENYIEIMDNMHIAENKKSIKDITLYLLKLCNDKYIMVDAGNGLGPQFNINPNEMFSPQTKYFISAAGRLFIEQGGYAKRTEKENTELLTKKILNVSLIVGGIVTSLYYLVKGLIWILGNC